MKTILCVPLHRDRFCEKARERGADRILWDLEDSVPKAEVGKARANAKVWVEPGDALRIRETKDLDLAFSLGAEPWIPKVSDPNKVAGGSVPILELPGSVLRARAFATGAGLAFGEHDLMAVLGNERLADWCRPFVSLAAAEAGIPSYDSPCASLLTSEVSRAARTAKFLGFSYKGAMSPSQLPAIQDVHESFAATAGEGTSVNGAIVTGPPMRKRAERCRG